MEPPQDQDKHVRIIAIDDSQVRNNMTVVVEGVEEKSEEYLQVDRNVLSNAFGYKRNAGVHELLQFVPFNCGITVSGVTITSIDVYQLPHQYYAEHD